MYVRAQVTVNESVSGFYLGGNAKFHLADGSVANGAKPGRMSLCRLQHGITPFVQEHRRNVRLLNYYANHCTYIKFIKFYTLKH